MVDVLQICNAQAILLCNIAINSRLVAKAATPVRYEGGLIGNPRVWPVFREAQRHFKQRVIVNFSCYSAFPECSAEVSATMQICSIRLQKYFFTLSSRSPMATRSCAPERMARMLLRRFSDAHAHDGREGWRLGCATFCAAEG